MNQLMQVIEVAVVPPRDRADFKPMGKNDVPTIATFERVMVLRHDGWCDECGCFHDGYCDWDVVRAMAKKFPPVPDAREQFAHLKCCLRRDGGWEQGP